MGEPERTTPDDMEARLRALTAAHEALLMTLRAKDERISALERDRRTLHQKHTQAKQNLRRLLYDELPARLGALRALPTGGELHRAAPSSPGTAPRERLVGDSTLAVEQRTDQPHPAAVGASARSVEVCGELGEARGGRPHAERRLKRLVRRRALAAQPPPSS